MIANKETIYSKDQANKKMKVVRDFDAPVEDVWRAFTDPTILDQWWAPKPWKTNTKSMDFRPGGRWLYYMQGPDGSRHYCLNDYETVVPKKSYSGLDAFCDEQGNIIPEMPRMQWKVEFASIEDGTRVTVDVTFPSEADLEKIVEMGFKEGFAMAHRNLDEYFETGTVNHSS